MEESLKEIDIGLETKGSAAGLKVKVYDPEKRGEGIHSHIVYKVKENTKKEYVERRYSDFVWLHQRLQMEHPGMIVPPLPEKELVGKFLGRFDPAFIESRRRALETSLHRTKNHYALGKSECLELFLTLQDVPVEGISHHASIVSRAAEDDKVKSSGGFGIMQWFDETVQQISSTLGSGIVLEKTDRDVQFEKVQSYIDGLEPIIIEIQKHAHGLTKRSREMADGLFDFGVSFTLLGQSESDPFGAGLGQVGHCADRLSVLSLEQSENELLHFEEPLMDYVRLIQAVRTILRQRNNAKLTYATALGDLESKQILMDKATKAEKIEAATNERNRAQQRVNQVKVHYELITDNVLSEVH